MARVVLQNTQGRQVVELGAVNKIGRHPNCTIQILDGLASKEHCVIEAQGAAMVLRDLGSSNGTVVGQIRLTTPHVLRHGDEIRLGNTVMIFDDGITQIPILTPPLSAGAVDRVVAAPFGTQSGRVVTAPAMPAVNMSSSGHEIGTQVAAQSKDFVPFDEVARDPAMLRLDYERLRITWELLREIGLERDLTRLLEKILVALFRFVPADRGVILIREADGTLTPRAHRRRDQTTAEIKISSTILAHVVKERAGVLTHDASADFGASKGQSMFINQISSALVVPLLHDKDVIGALWLDAQRMNIFKPKDLELITAVGNQVAMLVSNSLLASKVEKEILTRKRFSRLLSPNVAEQVISGQLEIAKGGIQVPEATVFNSDLRGFTRMSEGTTADKMVELLNDYFELMVEVIFKYEGTLDKFMGDGIMAFWGAPVAHADDATRSVLCSLDQMDVLGELNERRKAAGEIPLAMGIGLHSGSLVSGYVGSSKSLSYTVIGDTVNVSARLCGIAAAGQILITEVVAAKLDGRFKVDPLPAVSLKGKEKPVAVFSVSRA
jgi:adenylate cyclase|nr:adenylate/guanylate cyclase domain-containing protein [Kofleriaceae bacterium]